MNIPLFPEIPRPLIFGHRGCTSTAVENTMEAFQHCFEQNIIGIELDVHQCQSGQLVVIHDHNLNRLTGQEATVENVSWEQLRMLELSETAQARIPLLEEVFSSFTNQFIYDVELKQEGIQDTGLATALWEMIRRYALEKSVLVSSFNPFVLRQFNRACDYTVPTAVIYSEAPEIPKFLRHGWGRHIARCSAMKPDISVLDKDKMKKKGYPIITWTLNDPEKAYQYYQQGVEGFISDDPLALRNRFYHR
jgi:glycerophosphoryl diester phosphodiesterase